MAWACPPTRAGHRLRPPPDPLLDAERDRGAPARLGPRNTAAEATCLHLRYDADATVDIYPVDDDYFVDINPFELQFRVTGYEPLEKVGMVRPDLSTEEFSALCDAVGPAPDTVPGRRTSSLGEGVVNASPFCFLCGGTDGLEGKTSKQHGSVQIVCSTCSADLSDRYGDPTPEVPAAAPSRRTAASSSRDHPSPAPWRLTGAPLRLLLVAAAPSPGTSVETARSLTRALHLRPDVEMSIVWLLDGDDAGRWEDACSQSMVVDRLRTWGPAVRLERAGMMGAAQRARGLELRRRLWRLGTFDERCSTRASEIASCRACGSPFVRSGCGRPAPSQSQRSMTIPGPTST